MIKIAAHLPIMTSFKGSTPQNVKPNPPATYLTNPLQRDTVEFSFNKQALPVQNVTENAVITEKSKTFEKELNLIKNPEIKEMTTKLIEKLPDYFFSVPASGSGKYHPDYVQGEGGLVRHTKAAVGIANDLFRMEQFNTSDDNKDLIISALILHDGFKNGKTDNHKMTPEHPLLAAEFVKANSDNQDYAERMANLISSHMGQWNKDFNTGAEVTPKPQTNEQFLVHLCDYLASRKNLEYKFN